MVVRAAEPRQARPREQAALFVGRTVELAHLAATVAGPPAVAVVEGEAGIGKTRLVGELPGRPELADRRFVTGACRPIRDPFPLGPVLDAVHGLRRSLRQVPLSPVAGALRPLLPELVAVLPEFPGPAGDRSSERHRVFRALAELLAAVGPVVVVLEDLHWADEQTIEFLSYLLADPPPVSLVLTLRGEEAGQRVRALTAKLPARVSRAHTVLPPLDTPQTGALAAAILGVDRVPAEVAARLCHRASGLPFAVEQLLALLRERGGLTGGAREIAPLLEELEVPHAIRDYVLERVSRLPVQARPVLEVAAVLAQSAPERLVTTVLDRPEAEVADGLSLAIEAGLLVEHPADRVAFRHLLAAQAVYDAIPGPRRRRWHDRIAGALAAGPARPPEPPGEHTAQLGQIAYHLRRAGRTEEWAATAERAADQAGALGHDAEAVRLLEDVLRHAPLPPEQLGRLAVKLARAADELLHGHQRVVELLTGILGRNLPRPVRGELRFRLASLMDLTSAPLERRLLAEATRELDDRPGLRAWAMIALGIPMGEGVPVSEHRRWLRRALALLPRVGDPQFEIFLLGKIAMSLGLLGDPQWRHLTGQLEEATGGAPDSLNEVRAYDAVGEVACLVGDHPLAAGLLGPAQERAAACENRRLELSIRSHLLLLDYCRGRWDGLGERAGALLDALADFPRAGDTVALVAGCLALAQGNLDEARRRLSDLVHHREARALELLPMAAGALVRLAVTRGDTARALAGARRVLTVVESKRLWAPITRVLPHLAEALVAADRLPEARRLVTRCARELRGLDAPLAPAGLEHAQGFLAAAGRQGRPAAAHFLAAARRYDPLGCPYEAAHAREQAALSGFAGGDAGAEQPLRDAAATYRRLGADWDYARVARAARQHGISLPPVRGGPRGHGPELTPREREVAELAATGRTNKEIARELFISTKTVDKHLSAALRKLRVRSRTALARHLPVTSRTGS